MHMALNVLEDLKSSVRTLMMIEDMDGHQLPRIQ
jgi:hypothetical protein